MDMNNLVNRFAAQYGGNMPSFGGVMPVMEQGPSFGAAPVEMPVQSQEPTYSTPEGEFVGPKKPTREEMDFAKRQAEFKRMQEKFGFNEDGIIQEGKYAGERWYGPETKAWVRGYGIENIRKKPELMQELEYKARNEARRYAGLEEIPMPTVKTDMSFPQTQEEQDAFFRHIAMTGTFPNGQKAPSEMITMAGARAFPDVSKRAMDRETFEQKKVQREQAETQALQNTVRYAEPMLGSIRNAKKILEEKGNLAAGVWANKLFPSYNQSYQDLKANLDAIGGSLLADSVKALRETSPNGTLGLRLTEKEILKEIQRMGPQAMEASPEQLLETLNRLEQMTTDSLNYAKGRLGGEKKKTEQQTPAQPASSSPKRFKFTANGDLIGG